MNNLNFSVISLLEEIADLWKQEMVALYEPDSAQLAYMTNIVPAKMMVQGMGGMLYDLMELKNIDERDLGHVVSLLS